MQKFPIATVPPSTYIYKIKGSAQGKKKIVLVQLPNDDQESPGTELRSI